MTVKAKKIDKIKKKIGAPARYGNEVRDTICNRIAEGQSLLQICRDEGMPTKKAVMKWLNDPKYASFVHQYAKARELQAEHLFDEMLDIADDGSNDWHEIETKSGRLIDVIDHEAINRSRLRIDTRKWYLSKVLPKKFGERPGDITINNETHTHVTKIEVNGLKDNQIVEMLTGRVNGTTNAIPSKLA